MHVKVFFSWRDILKRFSRNVFSSSSDKEGLIAEEFELIHSSLVREFSPWVRKYVFRVLNDSITTFGFTQSSGLLSVEPSLIMSLVIRLLGLCEESVMLSLRSASLHCLRESWVRLRSSLAVSIGLSRSTGDKIANVLHLFKLYVQFLHCYLLFQAKFFHLTLNEFNVSRKDLQSLLLIPKQHSYFFFHLCLVS